MRILSIGNSFSHDAHRYLHKIAKSLGDDVKTVNLFIGGCSLETHYRNLLGDLAEYEYEENGDESSRRSSIDGALSEGGWDVVTLQQASHLSAKAETYYPYITELAKHVREKCPTAKIYIHQTWAYDNGSERLISTGYPSADEMFEDVKRSYEKAAEAIGADGVIYSGEAMLKALNSGINVYRDGFHAGFGAGRFLLGLVWYKTLTGNDISAAVDFNALDESVSESDRKTIIRIANDIKTNVR